MSQKSVPDPQDSFAYNREMLKPIHAEITRTALAETFSGRAVDLIIAANLRQDRLSGLIGHDEFHFDADAFDESYAYLEGQRALTISCLGANRAASAWSAFGRLLHAVQDFYAHSNYIELWLARRSNGARPAPPEVDPVDEDLIRGGALRSGRMYLPLEALYFIRPLRRVVLRLLPRDSHAWMNLDSSEQGINFEYAFHAAVKRTRIEFEKTASRLSQDLLQLFIDS